MADNTDVAQKPVAGEPSVDATPAAQPQVDPFDEKSWSDKPETSTPAATVGKTDTPATDTSKTTPPATDETVDEAEFLKTNFGFDDLEKGKAELARLRELEKRQTTTSGKDAIKKVIQEKKDEISRFIENDRTITALSNLELKDADSAAKILKANLRFKNPALTAEEVDYQFNRAYKMPAKPVQGQDETDGEFEARQTAYQEQVKEVQMGMMIDAKIAKPDLLKYTNELDLPDIELPVLTPEIPQPTAEELQAAKAAQESFYQAVDKGITELKSIDREYKEGNLTIPVKYEVSPDEQQAVAQAVKSLYTDWSFLTNRWKDASGNYDPVKIAQDVHTLLYSGKVQQKMINESAAQRFEAAFREKSNIQLTDQSNPSIVPGGVPDEMAQLQAQAWR